MGELSELFGAEDATCLSGWSPELSLTMANSTFAYKCSLFACASLCNFPGATSSLRPAEEEKRFFVVPLKPQRAIVAGIAWLFDFLKAVRRI